MGVLDITGMVGLDDDNFLCPGPPAGQRSKNLLKDASHINPLH